MNSSTFDVNMDNFQQEVIEASQKQLVLLEIWAEGYPECEQQQQVIGGLLQAYAGKLSLARLQVSDPDPKVQQIAQSLMMQLQINTVPALVFLSGGQPVKVLQGLNTEDQLKPLFDEFTMSPVERTQQEIAALMEQGFHQQALEKIQAVLQQEPENHGVQVLQVNVLLELGRVDDAKKLLALLPNDAPGIAQPKAKIDFYEMAQDLPVLRELEQKLEENPEDLTTKYQLAICQILDDQVEQSLENLLSIMQADRSFKEDGARLLMLKVFAFLGKGNGLASIYQRRLFSLMH